MALGILSCSVPKEENTDILLRYGDNSISKHEIIEMIPDGLSANDSAALFHQIIEGWIKDVVLSDFAEERLYDTQAIDRRVKDYRNSLIVLEYLSRMRESQNPKINEQNVKDYYDLHRKDLKLEVPLVKGIFLKINSDASHKEEIKSLITSDDPENIDRLEQRWLDRSLDYNYFPDKWIDWETVAGYIPHRFGDPDTFLKENRYFETEYGDCSYYLYISDYLPSSEEQPYEYAREWITKLLTQGELIDYENNLINSLVKKSIKEKKLEIIGYDPEMHELIESNVNLKDE